MIAVAVIIALVAGAFGGVMASACMEAYYQRQAQNQVGEYDAPDESGHRH